MGGKRRRPPDPAPTACADRAGVSLASRVARIDVLGIHADQPRELLDDDVGDERGEFILAFGACLHRPAVYDDAGLASWFTGIKPGQRDSVAVTGQRMWHLLDGELDGGQLRF